MLLPALLEADNVTKSFMARRRPRVGVGQADTQRAGRGQNNLRDGMINAVDGVSLAIPAEPTLISLVGESGSGKTTLSRMLLGLEKPTTGTIRYRGKDIFKLSKEEWKVYRREVQAVFQDPYAIYNPFYHVEHVFKMAIKHFKLADNAEKARALMEESLRAVDLRPQDVLGRYPHQLSGGERQRIMLARIYMLKPRVIIADEPVSMIDAAVRTLFMNILLDFRDQYGISCLFITHNLSTAYYLGGQLVVLCQGKIVEQGDMDEVINNPRHNYTRQLLNAVPSGDPEKRWTTKLTLEELNAY